MKTNQFIGIFLITIVITRLIIYFIPRTSRIYTDNFHHLYIGILLLVIYFLIKSNPLADYLLAIILGLIVDQITSSPFYLGALINKPLAPHLFWYYWSPYSLISTTVAVIISVFIIKKYK